MAGSGLVTIGEMARRTGLNPSAIRFYETRGLVHPTRNSGGQRRYARADIRRLSFALIAQKLGFSLEDIAAQLAELPLDRAPTKRDWTRISRRFRFRLDERIRHLTDLRDKLDGCIGCGCLSLETCRLYNPEDVASTRGSGPRFLLGDKPAGD